MFLIRSNDQAKIACYDYNRGCSKTIVLVHGWPLSHKMFEYQLPALINAGYRVVTLDLRGFGNSEETTCGYCYNQMADDLYHVVRALNLHRFALLGFSMGGAIVTRYMARYRGYGVCKLCLLDAAVPSYCKTERNPYGSSVEDTNQLIEMGYEDRPALNQYFGSIFFAKKHSQPFLDWFQGVNDSASGLGEMQCLAALRDEDVFDDLRCIFVPTGIFHGKEDRICSYEMAELTHRNIKSSRLFPLEDAGHGAFYDVRESFNHQLVCFLDGTLS